MSIREETELRSSPHYLCPIAVRPFEECYCREITSRTVPQIAMYCMERFRYCPVWKKRVTGSAEGGTDRTGRNRVS